MVSRSSIFDPPGASKEYAEDVSGDSGSDCNVVEDGGGADLLCCERRSKLEDAVDGEGVKGYDVDCG